MNDFRIVKTYLSSRPYQPAALVTLLTWSLLVLMSLIFWEDWYGLSEALPVSKHSLFEQDQHWRAWTAVFIHGDLGHLLSNSMFFIIFGYLLYGYFGKGLFPIGTLLGAVVTNYITILFYPPMVRLVGASGWVYVLAGVWLTLFCLIERRLSLIGRILRFTGISLVLLLPETFRSEVSYLSHGVGFAVGVLIALFYFAMNRNWIRSFEVFKPWETEAPDGDDSTEDPDHPVPLTENSP